MTEEEKPDEPELQPVDPEDSGTNEESEEKDHPALEGHDPGRKGAPPGLCLLLFFAILLVAGAVLVPNFIRARSRGQLTACKSNLKNVGTAMEMYSTDWSGKYPTGNVKEFLTPNYLKTIPECPAAGTDTYVFELGEKATYNTGTYEDYYFVRCQGSNHTPVAVPVDYPQYNGIIGLIER